MGLFGDIIGGVGSVVGGLVGADSARKTTNMNIDANRRQQTVANEFTASQAALDRAMQREFAQHGVSWKAADARAAGLDPVVAMGNTTLASPAGSAGSIVGNYGGSGSDYSWMSRAGQAFGSVADRWLTRKQRQEADALELKSKQLDNEWKILRNQDLQDRALNRQTQAPVAIPDTHSQVIPGQSDTPVVVVPDKVIRHDAAGRKMGVHAMEQWRLGPPDHTGRIPIYSALEEQAGDAMDADTPTRIRRNLRALRKYGAGLIGNYKDAKPNIKKKGYHLVWDRAYGQWMLEPNKQQRRRNNAPIYSIPLKPYHRGQKRFKIIY